MMKKKQQNHQDDEALVNDCQTPGEQTKDEALVDVGAAPEAENEVTVEAIPTEQSEIEKLRGELAEMNDKFLRLHADFENFRKRSFKEVSNVRTATVLDTIQPFIRVLDIFNMAVTSAQTAPNIDSIKQGMQMILVEYGKALDELGVTKFDAIGQKFDHSRHEAMANEASAEPEGIVIKQWSCGYQMGERLLRPARVVVSSGPEAK